MTSKVTIIFTSLSITHNLFSVMTFVENLNESGEYYKPLTSNEHTQKILSNIMSSKDILIFGVKFGALNSMLSSANNFLI